jgi:hypothetical protein
LTKSHATLAYARCIFGFTETKIDFEKLIIIKNESHIKLFIFGYIHKKLGSTN